ncbi:MAG: helix-turn-helix domain-containing protein [Proteobacteria bacterium]|nr:helix-turn-helix domain-containing protein [Pseudomonadota bacterium]
MTRRLKSKPYLKPSEVAELLRVEPGTVRLWNQSGKLRGTTTAGGHRRFQYRDIEAFAREHGIDLASPEEGSLRILIVDDDKRVTRMIKRILATADPDSKDRNFS